MDEEEGTCASCSGSGSGEGMFEGQNCRACKGSGVQMYPVEPEPENEEEDATGAVL